MSADMDYPERPNSEQYAELHVYVVPSDLWREHLNSAVNQIINDTISAGFLRVHPDMTIHSLREEVEIQLGMENIPQDYYFLKSVGRCLTRIKPKQEFRLKVKHFLPPLAYVPEIFMLEATPEVRALFPSSGTSSERSDSHGSWRNQMGTGQSDFNPHKPIPPIRNGQYSGNYNPAPQTRAPSRTNPEDQQPPAPIPAYEPWSHPNSTHQPGQPHPLRDSNYETPPDSHNGHQTNPREANLPPLSASPPAYPEADHVPGSHVNHTHSQTVPHGEQVNGGYGEYLPPLSATPPNSPGLHRHEGRQTNGIDAQRDEQERRRRMQREEEEKRAWEEEQHRRQEEEEEERRRQEIERKRREEEKQQRELEEKERQRKMWEEEQRRREEERQRWEEERHRWEEEQRQREEHDRQLEEDRKRQEENKERQRRLEEEQRLAQEQALPPVEEGPAESEEKTRLLADLEAARQERKALERQREDLVRKAKGLQGKSQSRRNQARDAWKKRYFEEKKKTPPLEEQANKLRQELETLHRRIMSQLEGSKEKAHRLDDKPSPQTNLKIQATKLQHEIEELQRRVENVKMKLTTEMKLRNQAETELRALRAELTQKKINVSLTRSQQFQSVNTAREMYSPRTPAPVASQR